MILTDRIELLNHIICTSWLNLDETNLWLGFYYSFQIAYRILKIVMQQTDGEYRFENDKESLLPCISKIKRKANKRTDNWRSSVPCSTMLCFGKYLDLKMKMIKSLNRLWIALLTSWLYSKIEDGQLLRTDQL